MSAVSPEHIQTGEQNRTGDEPELQKVGLLEPQTVFVILDSSETLNLVRWVCILGPTQLEPEPAYRVASYTAHCTTIITFK